LKVLVTGGAGYVGSHAVKALLSAGVDVLVLDNLTYGHREFVDAKKLVVGDLSDVALLKKLFDTHSFDAVMHFAAYAYVGESVGNPSKYYHNNVAATLNLLDAMVQHHTLNFIFSSTCATYGLPLHLPLREDHPQSPVNPYGHTKWMVERILKDYDHAYGLKSISLRYFNAAGADPEGRIGEDHDPETHLIPLVLDAAIGKRPNVTIFGTDYDTEDGTCIRDYIHVCDLAEAHHLALKLLDAEKRSDFFNLGNGSGFSVRQVIDTAGHVTKRQIPVRIGSRRAGDPPTLIGCSEKAKKTLGWNPKFADLPTIIETAWNWHQKRFSK